MVGIAGIIRTHCTSRKGEKPMKDAALWTAAGPPASKLYRFEVIKNGTGACPARPVKLRQNKRSVFNRVEAYFTGPISFNSLQKRSEVYPVKPARFLFNWVGFNLGGL